ncbi:MAG TPA: condensation domain-containing protein, partial [Longimicrobiaceae bacterium]
MTDLSSRLEQLSPAKRALLEKLAARAGGTAAAEPIRPRDGGGPAPLSFGQQRFWFLDRLQPGTPLYTIPAAFRLRGRLDVRALRAALADVVARHEALRTVFREVEGTPLQVVLPAVPAPLDVADLRALPEAARAAEAERRVREFLRLPFDLSRGPLLRAFAVRTDADGWTLALGVHHVASDGWSQGIVLRELAAAYAARSGAGAPPLPAPALQYPDYAVWQRGWLRGRVLEEQLAWWRERLAGGPAVLELPADRPRPAAMSQRGAKHYGRLPAEVAEAAEALARAEGGTPFMVLLAAFQLLLGRLAGEEEVRVATPVANRGRPETEGTVGFFVNTLVLRGDLSGDPTFRELLARVREETLGAFAHPDLPFERLVEELAPERSLGHAPLAQVSFALQNAPEAALRLPGCDAEETSPDLGVATLDLDVHLRRTARGLEWMARYSTDLWDAPSAALLAARYERLLRGALAGPDARVSALPLLDDAERARVLEAWNPPPRPCPQDSVPALFAAQAALTPEAPAVSYGGETLTYAELHRRSLALAGELAARRVGPDARVGLLAERSPDMVVAMLAVLQAGGAYLPLDPDHPSERLAFMLDDAGARVLLAQRALLERVPGFAGEVVALDTPHPPAPSPTRGEGEHDDADPREALPRNGGGWRASSEPGGGLLADADSLAYVIYTSGSTGRPKGVAVPHRGIVRLVRDADL